MNPNAPNAMIARLKKRSGPPNTVIAKGRNRGITPMLLSLRKNGLTSLFKEVRVFKGHEYWEVLSPPSVCLNREFPCVFVYCFSCRYLVELGLRQLGLPVPNLSRRHLSALNFKFNFIFHGGRTREE